jgi:acyl-CoA dehydrogenase
MRLIGVAERALETMCRRGRRARRVRQDARGAGSIRRDIALSRDRDRSGAAVDLNAAHLMDTAGNKAARAQIAMIKVVAPNVALQVLDRAIQAHGAAGVSQDTFLAYAWAQSRTLRLAGGPDEVHLETIAKLE